MNAGRELWVDGEGGNLNGGRAPTFLPNGVGAQSAPRSCVSREKTTWGQKGFRWLSELFSGSPAVTMGPQFTCEMESEVVKVLVGKRLHAFHTDIWSEPCHACGRNVRGAINLQLAQRGLIIVLCDECEKEFLIYSMRHWLRAVKGRQAAGAFIGPIKRDAVLPPTAVAP